MKTVLVGLMVAGIAGCTTFRPVGGSSSEVQRSIEAHALLHRGDRARITTFDGTAHSLVVTETYGGAVIGKHASVPIEQIRSVEMRTVRVGKPVDVIAVVYLVGLAAIVASYQSPQHL